MHKKEVKILSQRIAELNDILALKTEGSSHVGSALPAPAACIPRQTSFTSRFVSFVSHDIQAPLKYLLFSAGKIPDMLIAGDLEEVSRVSTFISNTSARMSTVLDRVIPLVRAQLHDLSAGASEIDMYQFIEEKLAYARQQLPDESREVHHNLTADQYVDATPDLFSLMIDHLLAEAVRHTASGQIRISLEAISEMSSELTIETTLQGVPENVSQIVDSADDDEIIKQLFRHDHTPCSGLLVARAAAVLSGLPVRVEMKDMLRLCVRLGKLRSAEST